MLSEITGGLPTWGLMEYLSLNLAMTRKVKVVIDYYYRIQVRPTSRKNKGILIRHLIMVFFVEH